MSIEKNEKAQYRPTYLTTKSGLRFCGGFTLLSARLPAGRDS